MIYNDSHVVHFRPSVSLVSKMEYFDLLEQQSRKKMPIKDGHSVHWYRCERVSQGTDYRSEGGEGWFMNISAIIACTEPQFCTEPDDLYYNVSGEGRHRISVYGKMRALVVPLNCPIDVKQPTLYNFHKAHIVFETLHGNQEVIENFWKLHSKTTC